MQRDWLDHVAWAPVGIGILVGTLLQLVLGLLLSIAGRSATSGTGLLLANGAVMVSGFTVAWWLWPRREEKSPLLNSLLVGLFCTFISLVASILASQGDASLLGVLVLFAGYSFSAVFGAIFALFLAPRLRKRDPVRWP